MTLADMGMSFCGVGAATGVWELQGGVNKVAKALDAMGSHWRTEGIEREWKGCCPEREKELFTLFKIGRAHV